MQRLTSIVVRWPLAVIGIWVALAIALPLAFPSLATMAEKNPLAVLPSDAPSSLTAKKMTEVFQEPGSDDLLLISLINEKGLGPADEATYRKLVGALRDDVTDVVTVQDFLSTPQLRQFLTSEDKSTWVLPVGLAGELGTPRSYEAFQRVAELVERNVAGSDLDVHLVGPAATVADLTAAGQRDRLPIEIAIGVLVLGLLLIVYRSAITMLLPLVTIGSALVIAQALVAGYSELTGAGVSSQSIIFLTAIMAGAGTDYAVFLISRYHDYIRSGSSNQQAVTAAMFSIGKVISASAVTMGITFLLLSFCKMGVFRTVGVSSALGIGVAYLATLTLLPAILVLAGPRGWVKPRRELTARMWRRSGIRIVRRPVIHLVTSLLILGILGSFVMFARYNYDDRKMVAASAPSSIGYAAVDKRYPITESIPEYIFVQSPRDLRSPQALADLEQMASRVAQLPGIARVSGITRPLGEVPPEFRATFQAGIVGDRLADGSAMIGQRSGDLTKLVDGAKTLAGSLGDVRTQVNKLAPTIQGVLDGMASVRTKEGGDKLVRDVEAAVKIVNTLTELTKSVGFNFAAAKIMLTGAGPVLKVLQDSAACTADPECSASRMQYQRLVDARADERVELLDTLNEQMQAFGDKDDADASLKKLNGMVAGLSKAVATLGLNTPDGVQRGLNQMRQGADRLAGGSQAVAGGVDALVGQVKLMASGLTEASAFLSTMRSSAADPSMAGFNIPPQVLALPDFEKASAAFISPDGHSVRYLVQTKLNPFSYEAMDQVNEIADTARSAQPNTSLSDATISMGGFPVALRDTRDYYQADIRFIIIATLIVVLLTLMVLLRAIVAPLYLVGSVVVSYFAAIGIGVLTFQFLLGQELHWSVPPLAFVILVAVGADYNMLLMSRIRDESRRSLRYGIIRTLGSTGGVITAAGLIFAASMAGLMFSSILIVVQGGFVIGVGIVLDTFVVRTITVPAMATLVGRANFWPSRVGAQPNASPTPVGSESP